MLSRLDDAQLRICRNFPYARHGRPFADRALRRYFYESGRPRHGGQLRLIPYAERSDYRDAWLSRDDHRYIAFIQAEERRRHSAAGPRR